MVIVTDVALEDDSDTDRTSLARRDLFAASLVTVLAGALLAWAAHSGAARLLVAIAVGQALLAWSWMVLLRPPGRVGGVVVVGLAACAADVAVSVWPHSRLGPLLAVLGLAVPAMFVHQLSRGAARVRVLESLSGVTLLLLAEVCWPALLQLRHEFSATRAGGDVGFGVVLIATLALLIGYLIDLVLAVPRFDAEVPRGVLAVLASIAVGAGVGQLSLHESAAFAGARAVFTGAVLGALVALLAVAVALLEHGTPRSGAGFGRPTRPVLTALVPLSLLWPVALLLCLAVRAR